MLIKYIIPKYCGIKLKDIIIFKLNTLRTYLAVICHHNFIVDLMDGLIAY